MRVLINSKINTRVSKTYLNLLLQLQIYVKLESRILKLSQNMIYTVQQVKNILETQNL